MFFVFLFFSSHNDIHHHNQLDRIHLKYRDDIKISLYWSDEDSFLIYSVDPVSGINSAINKLLWMNNTEETCPHLLVPKSYPPIFYFIAFPVNYIDRVCSNVFQVHKKSSVELSCYLEALIDYFFIVCVQ